MRPGAGPPMGMGARVITRAIIDASTGRKANVGISTDVEDSTVSFTAMISSKRADVKYGPEDGVYSNITLYTDGCESSASRCSMGRGGYACRCADKRTAKTVIVGSGLRKRRLPVPQGPESGFVRKSGCVR